MVSLHFGMARAKDDMEVESELKLISYLRKSFLFTLPNKIYYAWGRRVYIVVTYPRMTDRNVHLIRIGTTMQAHNMQVVIFYNNPSLPYLSL